MKETVILDLTLQYLFQQDLNFDHNFTYYLHIILIKMFRYFFLFRQEPVVYVNNKPFTARDPKK